MIIIRIRKKKTPSTRRRIMAKKRIAGKAVNRSKSNINAVKQRKTGRKINRDIYNKGYNEGFDQAYDEGFNKGYAQGTEQGNQKD